MQVPAFDILGSEAALPKIRSIFSEYGFVAVRNAATAALARELRNESQEFLGSLKRAVRADAQLRYSAGIAMLGPQALSFLTGSVLANSLLALTGERFVLTTNMSCITVYEPGDVLGAHLDQPAEQCALTCILYLSCSSPKPESQETGLQLKIFGGAIESTRRAPRQIIPTQPGLLVLGRGASIWHERPQLQPQETVVALTACFGAA